MSDYAGGGGGKDWGGNVPTQYMRVGLSTDTKPTLTPQEQNALHYETDTGNTHVWDGSAWHELVKPATEETVSQLVKAHTNALTLSAEDLSAGAYSGVTSIANDYDLNSLRLKFSTNELRTITLIDSNGTKLYEDTNTLFHIYIPTSVIGGGFNGGENITLTITQTTGVCTVTGVLITTSGTNTLIGDPRVQGEDQILGGSQPLPVDRDGRYIPIIDSEHTRIHEGLGFTCTGKASVANGANFDVLIKNPAGNFPHFRFYAFSSEKGPSDVFLYEGTTVSADGAPCNIYNNSRNSSNTPNPSFFSAPTVTGVGTEIEYSLIVAGKHVGGSAESISVEWNLKPNENYMVRYTNNSGQASIIGYHIFFYDTAV